MIEEGGFFVVIGGCDDLIRTRPTNIGPYLISFKLLGSKVTHWGNRVINFGLSPDLANVTRVDEQIPLPAAVTRLTLMGLTDLAVVSRHQGPLRVRFRSIDCVSPDETHEFRVTGPRRFLTSAEIRALEFELTQHTGYNGITIVDISVVAP